MKHFVFAVALALSPITATSVSADQNFCASIGENARVIMTNRQYGTPIGDMLALTDEPVLISIILDAYRHPKFSTREFIENEINEFGNVWTIACIDSLAGE